MSTRPVSRHPRRRARVLAVPAALLALAGALFATAPASASTPGVELSSDGVHFAATYSGSLFASTGLMVPQSTQTGEFWVRNASSGPAYLRVSISGLSGGGTAFSGSLTVSAAPAGTAGTLVPVDSAAPCYVLTQGRLLAPGAVVKIVARLALADLTGTAGQNSTAGFDVLVGLSSAAYGSLPPTTCPSPGGVVPGTPGGGGTGGMGGHGGSGGSGGSGGIAGPTGGGGPDGIAPGTATGVYATPDTLDGSVFAGHAAAILDGSTGLEGNTGRFYQEWFVILWVLGALAGGAARVVWVRVRAYEEREEVVPWQAGVRSSVRGAFSTT